MFVFLSGANWREKSHRWYASTSLSLSCWQQKTRFWVVIYVVVLAEYKPSSPDINHMFFNFTTGNGVLGAGSSDCACCYHDRPFLQSSSCSFLWCFHRNTNTYTQHLHSYFINTISINLTKFKVLRLKCAIFLPSSCNCYEVITTCHFWNWYLLPSWYFEALNNLLSVQGLTLTDGFFVKSQNQNPPLHCPLDTCGRTSKISFTKDIHKDPIPKMHQYLCLQ